MKVINQRWGEVTIKKQGIRKNQFDTTKSFSIQKTKNEYNIEQLKTLFERVVNLSEKYTFEELKQKLIDLE